MNFVRKPCRVCPTNKCNGCPALIKASETINWAKVLDNAEQVAKESFGKPDVILPDVQKAWDQLKEILKGKVKNEN